MSYQESTTQAIHNAGRALKETGADAVKLEGANPEILEIVDRLTHIGIPVMGHVGLTPQSVKQLGFKQQGKSALEGDRILSEALGLQAAGAFSIVLEHIPTDLATQISKTLTIPTIGIGAGPDCDGQVLVTADLLGLSEWQPPFAKVYTNLRQTMQEAVGRYAQEVRTGEYRNNPSQQ
jgi:3-methyl-2-oxobutanoate hydroxymethyltransferase